MKITTRPYFWSVFIFFLISLGQSCSPQRDSVNSNAKAGDLKENYSALEKSLKTSEGIAISYSVHMPLLHKGEKRPALILLHQGGSDRREWDPFLENFKKTGFIIIVPDLRGHGKSTAMANFRRIYTDPDVGPRDLNALLSKINGCPSLDGWKIYLVGASVGGNLAVVARMQSRVKKAVAISVKSEAISQLAGQKPVGITGIFFISSEQDQQGMRKKWSEELYSQNRRDNKISIVSGDEHGVSILSRYPQLLPEIIDWLR